ncbi:MAG: pyruvate kinase [Candidatus Methylopumilus sp.]
MHLRKTKIIATLGPSSSSEEMIARLINSGVDVFRLNFSHGSTESHIKQAEIIRAISKGLNTSIGILCDLQGPKLRIGKFKDGQIELTKGDVFVLDANCELGDKQRVGLDYKNLPHEVSAGTLLLLDDGRISLHVNEVLNDEIYCSVVTGGVLSNNKGINRQGGGLSAPSITQKDEEDIKTAVSICADFIAISFPKSAADIHHAKDLIKQAGGYAHVVAKIERTEAVAALKEIIEASDVVMVARGDLGVEIGDALVPGLQKRIIKMARANNKIVITATQMMESMISNPIPTRAEVSDVANAVLDGTDAVMLSAETASGKYPLETVEAVNRVCLEAEHEQELQQLNMFEEKSFTNIDESIAMAASYIANHLPIKAIASLTQSGITTLWLSRANHHVPIYALSTESKTRRRLKLYRGVYPISLDSDTHDKNEILLIAEKAIKNEEKLEHGDMMLITIGEPVGVAGSTNSLKIIKIDETLVLKK